MLKKLFLVLLVVAGLTIGLAGCLEEGEAPPPGEEPMMEEPAETY